MKFQVLISTMNKKNREDIKSLLKKMNIKRNYYIVNQSSNSDIPCIYHTENGEVYTYNEKGLSRSRNRCLFESKNDICLISDENVTYVDNFDNIIINQFIKHKEYDVIAFYVENAKPINNLKNGKVNLLNSMKLCSVQIAFRKKSIIEKNIQFDGRLKKDFRILDENVWKGNDDGQEDVQCLEYIDNMIEADIKGLLDIIFKIEVNNYDKIEKELEIYFENYRDTILIYREPLLKYFSRNEISISSQNNIFNFFKKMLTKSRNIFVIKISIIILNSLNLEYNIELLEIIKILALCSEFTLLGVLFIKTLKNIDINKEIYELAKKVYTWGKMACIFYLEANSNEIKDWILNESTEENILYNFVAITYSDKADIRKRLKKISFKKNEFSKISFLIYSLLFLDEEKGIIFLDYKEELLINYLERAKSIELSETDYLTIEEISSYMEDDIYYMEELGREMREDEYFFPLEISNKLLKECKEILNNRN